ncbi:hypothetical protein [Gordonia rhizosphera]|uniref:Uncharacterized protein n=1 Tax=Gordonia rhizosphera NBRC 16068 TaxID=1108045 RepID=K6WWU4_9ACTN|nr:hypothetical protein [Gordonia rhizosphera]GAB91039.1 hypothetical protein GORHZ_121_00320 [Gordonia rhizosphera NBRC 16068]
MSDTAGDDVPHVYLDHLTDQLDGERARQVTLTARAETIVKTVLALLTVVIAVLAFVFGGAVEFRPHAVTVAVVVVAILVGIGTLVAGTFALTLPPADAGTRLDTLNGMASEYWWLTHDPGDALFTVARRKFESIAVLRTANRQRTTLCRTALYGQLATMAVLSAAVIVEIIARA